MSIHWIALNGRTHKVVITPGAPPTVDGVPLPVDLRELEPGVLSILHTQPNGSIRSFRLVADPRPEGDGLLAGGRRIPYAVSDPRSLRTSSASAGDEGPRPLKAPMPGRIVRVLVAAGDVVEAGQGCVVIEAMKMQNELKAPRAGTVTRLTATVGETVASNAILLVLE